MFSMSNDFFMASQPAPRICEDFGLVGDGIELCFDGVRPGHDQAQRKGRGEHLNEEGFHVLDETLGRPPLISIIQKGELTVGISSTPGEKYFSARAR